MVKNIDGSLLTGSLNRKLIKVRPFSSAKTSDMSDYIKPTKKDFNPDIYVLHVRTNDLTLSDTPEKIAKHIFDKGNSIKTASNTLTLFTVVPRGDMNKEKAEKAIQIINNAHVQRNIPVINHTSINSKRHLN